MGKIIFAYDQNSGGVHIDPVDDPRTHNTVNTGKLILQFPRRILGACEGAVKVTANGCLNLKNQRKYFLRPRRQILTPLWQKTTAPMPGAVVHLGLSLLRFYAPVFFLDHQIAFINPKI